LGRAAAGAAALEQGFDNVLPERTLAAIRAHHLALKGPVTTPVGKGFTSVNVQLRKKLNLYAAVRPVRSLPGIKTRFDNIDMVIVRENTEGLYSGIENEVVPGVVTSLKVASEVACTRIARWAFRYATKKKRKKLTVFHKANIMKLTDGLFLNSARRIYEEEYPNIEYEETIIDAGCMKLVQNPDRMDVLLMENLYGDPRLRSVRRIGRRLGVVPAATSATKPPSSKPSTAPPPTSPAKASPTAGADHDRRNDAHHMGETAIAQKIRKGYDTVLTEGKSLTRDLGGSAGTDQFGDAVIAAMK
jgi:isocitrate dehydrogenase (NAD+)